MPTKTPGLVLNKNIKSANYNIDTYKKKIFIYGISLTSDERKEVINEDSKPPVQDSANINLIFFFKQSLKTFSAFFLILIGNIIK